MHTRYRTARPHTDIRPLVPDSPPSSFTPLLLNTATPQISDLTLVDLYTFTERWCVSSLSVCSCSRSAFPSITPIYRLLHRGSMLISSPTIRETVNPLLDRALMPDELDQWGAMSSQLDLPSMNERERVHPVSIGIETGPISTLSTEVAAKRIS